MQRECISIHVGQTGCRLGDRSWQLFGVEHDINAEGKKESNNATTDQNYRQFYDETETGVFTPRAVFVDSDIASAYALQNRSPIGNLLQPYQMISGKEDSSDIFARGCFASGEDYPERVEESIRKLTQNCENTQGFLLTHSTGGGTGAGQTARILEHLSVEYPKKVDLNFSVFPSKKVSSSIVDIYNTVLCMDTLIDFSNINVVLNNGFIYDICEQKLDLNDFDFCSMNDVIAHIISGTTAPLRFDSSGSFKSSSNSDGDVLSKIESFKSDICPYPRMNFPLASIAPYALKQTSLQKSDIKDLTENCLRNSSLNFNAGNLYPESFTDDFAIQFFDSDQKLHYQNQCLAMLLFYRGQSMTEGSINNSIQKIKSQKAIPLAEINDSNETLPEMKSIADWLPEKIQFELVKQKQRVLCENNNDEIYQQKKYPSFDDSLTMLYNTADIVNTLEEMCKKFDRLYNTRAYVHWYVGEGLEETLFFIARENIQRLIDEYKESSGKK